MKASGIILCGGRGSRVAGADKGLLPWRDSSLVEAVVERLAPQVDDIIISANRNIEQYTTLGYPVITDALPDYQGPLAGIASALPACRNSVAIVVPCDTPLLPADLAARLLSALEDSGVDLSFANDGRRSQYLFSAVRGRCLAGLESCLQTGERSVRGWHASLHCVEVDFSDCPEAFTNLNRSVVSRHEKSPP